MAGETRLMTKRGLHRIAGLGEIFWRLRTGISDGGDGVEVPIVARESWFGRRYLVGTEGF